MRRPRERGDQAVLAVEAVRDVLLELRVRVPHRRAVAGAQDIEVIAHAQALERAQVARHRAGFGADEHAARAEHRVAGEARAGAHEREVVGGVPRRRDSLERPEADALGERHVRLAAARRQRRRMALAQRRDRLGVVVVVVRERDPAESAALLDRVEHAAQMGVEQRPGVDHPCRVPADHPGVRAGRA